MKIAIVGTAPSSRMQAPFDNSEWKIWACSPGIAPDFSTFCDLPRFDAWFELHCFDEPSLAEKFNADGIEAYRVWMRKIAADGVQVVTQEPIDGGTSYPIENMIEKFGRYFTNTISYMIAYAIECGATDIMLAGVDMAAVDEYGAQRPSCEYFLGIAKGRGINVEIPLVSDLLKCRKMYAFDPEDAYGAKCKARQAELAGRVNQAKHEMELYSRKHASAVAAIDEIENCKKLMNGELTESLESTMAERQQRLAQEAEASWSEAAQRKETIVALTGAEEDTKYWSQWR
jgi:hypothetical protein